MDEKLQEIQDEIMVIYNKLEERERRKFMDFLRFLDEVCDEGRSA